MRRTREHEIQAIFGLTAEKKFEHFVKRVADEGIAWGLWDDGWALMTTSDGAIVFPLWPAPEYAELNRIGDWTKYTPREIPLADLLEKLIPSLAEKGVCLGIIPTPNGKGGTLPPEDLICALRKELEKYP